MVAEVAVVGAHEQLAGPVGITIDDSGQLYAASYRRNRVVRFLNDGASCQYRGVSASSEKLRGPSGLAFDGSGTLLAVTFLLVQVLLDDLFGGRVQVLHLELGRREDAPSLLRRCNTPCRRIFRVLPNVRAMCLV